MAHYGSHYIQAIQPMVHDYTPYQDLDSHNTQLIVTQCPKDGGVFTSTNQKGRKCLDPPLMIEMRVSAEDDPAELNLVNPFIFATLELWHEFEDEPVFGEKEKLLLHGTLVSSISRLRTPRGKDGGYFIFPDVVSKKAGGFRLRVNLYSTNRSYGTVSYITSVTTPSFEVLTQKEYKGAGESTALSKSFSEQGIKLRLRKDGKKKRPGKRRQDEDEEESHPVKRQQVLVEDDAPRESQSYAFMTMPHYANANAGPSGYGSSMPSQDWAGAAYQPHYGPSLSASAYTTTGLNATNLSMASYASFSQSHSSYGVSRAQQPQPGDRSDSFSDPTYRYT